ncbi:hypothetical protein T12_6737 [Trichinella patagoniensis]|uniref:Uncharacterized protein n=1 Tax=Trichinella patagoniensis TaxID=990121 RepID=A0A0V0ZKD2_9BILA|nr:hypothetical protein T12_6737 [Trichinella patagoniensis]
MIRITPECNALNANASPNGNELDEYPTQWPLCLAAQPSKPLPTSFAPLTHCPGTPLLPRVVPECHQDATHLYRVTSVYRKVM